MLQQHQSFLSLWEGVTRRNPGSLPHPGSFDEESWPTTYLSQYWSIISRGIWMILCISLLRLVAINAGKYFSHTHSYCNGSIRQVIQPILCPIGKRMENSLSKFVLQIDTPLGFIPKQTTWNSWRCLFGSSPATPQNLGTN